MRKLAKSIQLLRDLDRMDKLPYLATLATNESDIKAARRLQAKIYLHRGNVDKSQITKQGFLDKQTDPFVNQSKYFLVRTTSVDKKPVAAARFIFPEDESGMNSLQIIQRDLIREKDLALHGVSRTDSIVEVSALVKELNERSVVTFLLYREMFSYSRDNHIKYWVMAVTDKIHGRLRGVFGKAFIDISKKKKLPQSNNHVHPTLLRVEELKATLEAEIKQANFLRRRTLKRISKIL